MAQFATTVHALDPESGSLLQWSGPVIEAENWTEAEQYVKENGLGYCKVTAIISNEPILSEADMDAIQPALI